jgi:REP element-mobilizing transposase RayT
MKSDDQGGHHLTALTPERGPHGWHSRGYVPHFDAGEAPQSITFRLAGSLPAVLLQRWREELQLATLRTASRSHDEHVERQRRAAAAEERRRAEEYLNRGVGPRWLADPRLGSLVVDALRFFDGRRYHLHAWVVMPNHVHVVMTPSTDESLSRIVASWKSYTASRGNLMLGRRGAFWHADYFDRLIRNEEHFLAAVSYVENNPVVAGLCATPEDWPFSSAQLRSVQ